MQPLPNPTARFLLIVYFETQAVKLLINSLLSSLQHSHNLTYQQQNQVIV
jgi:hypothetical protein